MCRFVNVPISYAIVLAQLRECTTALLRARIQKRIQKRVQERKKASIY